jgi:hypothetical protein
VKFKLPIELLRSRELIMRRVRATRWLSSLRSTSAGPQCKSTWDQVAAGFLGLRGLALAGLCAFAGLMASGLPAAAGVTVDSGSLKNARHPGVSWDLFLIMQTVTRPTSGISALQRRNASALQACCCSSV